MILNLGQCKSFLVKIGSIIFSDFRLVEKFTTACQDDISKFNCGRLDSEEEVFLFVSNLKFMSLCHFQIHRETTNKDQRLNACRSMYEIWLKNAIYKRCGLLNSRQIIFISIIIASSRYFYKLIGGWLSFGSTTFSRLSRWSWKILSQHSSWWGTCLQMSHQKQNAERYEH
jgi:hypothetical protein